MCGWSSLSHRMVIKSTCRWPGALSCRLRIGLQYNFRELLAFIMFYQFYPKWTLTEFEGLEHTFNEKHAPNKSGLPVDQWDGLTLKFLVAKRWFHLEKTFQLGVLKIGRFPKTMAFNTKSWPSFGSGMMDEWIWSVVHPWKIEENWFPTGHPAASCGPCPAFVIQFFHIWGTQQSATRIYRNLAALAVLGFWQRTGVEPINNV